MLQDTTSHYNATPLLCSIATWLYNATGSYSLSVFATTCYHQNGGLLMFIVCGGGQVSGSWSPLYVLWVWGSRPCHCLPLCIISHPHIYWKSSALSSCLTAGVQAHLLLLQWLLWCYCLRGIIVVSSSLTVGVASKLASIGEWCLLCFLAFYYSVHSHEMVEAFLC